MGYCSLGRFLIARRKCKARNLTCPQVLKPVTFSHVTIFALRLRLACTCVSSPVFLPARSFSFRLFMVCFCLVGSCYGVPSKAMQPKPSSISACFLLNVPKWCRICVSRLWHVLHLLLPFCKYLSSVLQDMAMCHPACDGVLFENTLCPPT